MAVRYCADLRIDTERFRAFAHANHLNHADFFTLKRSVALQQDINAEAKALREKPQEACAALWDRYGSAGQRGSTPRQTLRTPPDPAALAP